MKRIFCFLLCVCLLFSFSLSFPVSARAISPEVILLPAAAGLFSLVSSLMSVDYTFSNFDSSLFSSFWGSDPLQEIGKFWVSNISGGMIQIRGDLPSLQSLVSVAADKISSLGILDNSSGVAVSDSYFSFDGHKLPWVVGTQQISSPGTYDIGDSDYYLHLVATDHSYNTQLFYPSGHSSVFTARVSANGIFGCAVVSYASNIPKLCKIINGSIRQNSEYVLLPGSVVSVDYSADYVSGVIDTGIADLVPPSGGIQITMPYAGQPNLTDIFSSLNQAILDGDTASISAEVLDDVGVPIDTEQIISSTPWSFLDSWLSTISGALSGIRTGISSMVQSLENVGETILEAVESGPIKLFQSVLDLIGTSFSAVFARIRFGLGIWRYVTNWLGSISSPLSFLSSVLPSGVWVPIYASVAGSLVIAIFRRFGR